MTAKVEKKVHGSDYFKYEEYLIDHELICDVEIARDKKLLFYRCWNKEDTFGMMRFFVYFTDKNKERFDFN